MTNQTIRGMLGEEYDDGGIDAFHLDPYLMGLTKCQIRRSKSFSVC